jgi:phospholipid/cholesterol/gamma-HCH transport system substrate-binding protein
MSIRRLESLKTIRNKNIDMKLFSKEVKIALVAVVGVVILFFGMNFLKGLSLFSNDNNYFVAFQDVTGLSESSPIYADGFKVGVVKGVSYDYGNNTDIKVKIQVDKNLRIPKGSSAEIVSDMLGNVRVNLLINRSENEFLTPGDVIVGRVSAGAIGKVADMIPAIEKMLPKLDSIMASLNTLLADPAIAQSLHNIKNVTANLTTTSQQLNVLMAGLNQGVPTMMHKANGVLDNTNRLTANLANVDVAGTMVEVNQTLAGVQAFTDKLNNKNSSLGLLMNDASVYNNLNSTMRNADSLMVNIRQHPKRYVHFSVFGKKDK